MFLRQSGAAAALAMTRRWPLPTAASPFDVVIRGAEVIDGTGAPPIRADLATKGRHIAQFGRIARAEPLVELDATGLTLCPGFIDIHTHSDGSIFDYPTADSRVRQGVTTEVTGNCGSSRAPRTGSNSESSTVAAYMKRVDELGISLNHALLLGQGTLRRNAVGLVDRELTKSELDSVLHEVELGLRAGAYGLSTGLEYTPGLWTPPEEIVAMARVVARHGGLYASHMRNEEERLLEAVHETLEVGRKTGVRIEISHLKAAGRPNWNKQAAALHLIEAARKEGVDVMADAYPYTAYSTGLMILIDEWAKEGGNAAFLERLRNPEQRARIRAPLDARVAADPGDWKLIVISRVGAGRNRDAIGRNLRDIAASWKSSPADAMLRLLEEENASVGFIGHGMSADNVARVLRHPLVMIGSDGNSMAPTGSAAATRPHPRSYGTFPRVLGHFSRDLKLFDLPTAVKKMTSMPADQIGLADRGRLAPGMAADLCLFDAAKVKDDATFDDPHRYPTGIPHVLVNGKFVVRDGNHTGAKPGGMLRRR